MDNPLRMAKKNQGTQPVFTLCVHTSLILLSFHSARNYGLLLYPLSLAKKNQGKLYKSLILPPIHSARFFQQLIKDNPLNVAKKNQGIQPASTLDVYMLQ